MDIQFSNHALQRICGRFGSLVIYAEIQQAISFRAQNSQLRPGNNEVPVKLLSHVYVVYDETAVAKTIRGNRVLALFCHMKKMPVTVAQ